MKSHQDITLQFNPSTQHSSAYDRGGIQRIISHINTSTPFFHENGRFTDKTGHFKPRAGCFLASRYRIIGNVGSTSCGQSAVVVTAKDEFDSDKTVVIKVLHKMWLPSGREETYCLWKLQAADTFGASNIVRLLNTFRFDNHYCLVFEALVPDPIISIFHYVPPEQLLPCIRKVALRLLATLGFLKQENVIHADVKPENILLKKEGDLSTVTLIDFGNAIQNVLSEISLYFNDFELQTLIYRAPEVMFGIPFGTEIDMWSFGSVLAELYMGRPIFLGKSKFVMLSEITKVLGPCPANVYQKGKYFSSLRCFTSDKPQRDAREYLGKTLGCDDYLFQDFIAGLLQYDPRERMTPYQAAMHPFLAKELPLGFLLPAKDMKTFYEDSFEPANFPESNDSSPFEKQSCTSESDPFLDFTSDEFNFSDDEAHELLISPINSVVSHQVTRHMSRKQKDTTLKRVSWETKLHEDVVLNPGIETYNVNSDSSMKSCLKNIHMCRRKRLKRTCDPEQIGSNEYQIAIAPQLDCKCSACTDCQNIVPEKRRNCLSDQKHKERQTYNQNIKHKERQTYNQEISHKERQTYNQDIKHKERQTYNQEISHKERQTYNQDINHKERKTYNQDNSHRERQTYNQDINHRERQTYNQDMKHKERQTYNEDINHKERQTYNQDIKHKERQTYNQDNSHREKQTYNQDINHRERQTYNQDIKHRERQTYNQDMKQIKIENKIDILSNTNSKSENGREVQRDRTGIAQNEKSMRFHTKSAADIQAKSINLYHKRISAKCRRAKKRLMFTNVLHHRKSSNTTACISNQDQYRRLYRLKTCSRQLNSKPRYSCRGRKFLNTKDRASSEYRTIPRAVANYNDITADANHQKRRTVSLENIPDLYQCQRDSETFTVKQQCVYRAEDVIGKSSREFKNEASEGFRDTGSSLSEWNEEHCYYTVYECTRPGSPVNVWKYLLMKRQLFLKCFETLRQIQRFGENGDEKFYSAKNTHQKYDPYRFKDDSPLSHFTECRRRSGISSENVPYAAGSPCESGVLEGRRDGRCSLTTAPPRLSDENNRNYRFQRKSEYLSESEDDLI